MKVITAKNVHEALPLGVQYLYQEGQDRGSRNGAVIQAPGAVTTVYAKPEERVLFWPERDANPFFHLFESLWMLAGRDDVESVTRYASNMRNYSDDGVRFHGAYGHRWRNSFTLFQVGKQIHPVDQLNVIARRLRDNPEDRRCVLQMWDAGEDLGGNGKDVPCNTTATFQRDIDGRLDLVVFCRSNDMIWGAYGANAVHFSFLLEYMARWIGCPVGTFTQVSVNFHAYRDVFLKVKDIRTDRMGWCYDPYSRRGKGVAPVPLPSDIDAFDRLSQELLVHAETGFNLPHTCSATTSEPFFDVAYTMLRAHHVWKTETDADKRFGEALNILYRQDRNVDWIRAGIEWMIRRQEVQARRKP